MEIWGTNMELSADKVIAITGASRGIGRATALALAEEGTRLAIMARSTEALSELDVELRKRGAVDVFYHATDLTEEGSCEKWIQAILDRWGRIDALINNAGIGIMKPVEQLADEDWARVIRTNLTAPFRLIRSVIGPMRKQGGGHIINVSSIAGEVGFAGGGAYCASKFGLQGLSDCLMQEVRRDGIKVTILGPGSVNTRFEGKGGEGASWKIQPEEIARTIVYLLKSPDNVMATKLQIRPTLKGKS